MSDTGVISDDAEAAVAYIRSLARKAAQMVLAKGDVGLPVDPRHPAFATEYIAECDRLLSSTPPLLQDALENAGYAAEGQNVDPFQGIVEVMQNADDRHANEVRVALRSQGSALQMLIVHDGGPVEYPHVLAMMLPFVSTILLSPCRCRGCLSAALMVPSSRFNSSSVGGGVSPRVSANFHSPAEGFRNCSREILDAADPWSISPFRCE